MHERGHAVIAHNAWRLAKGHPADGTVVGAPRHRIRGSRRLWLDLQIEQRFARIQLDRVAEVQAVHRNPCHTWTVRLAGIIHAQREDLERLALRGD